MLDIQSYVSLAGHEAAWEEPFFGRDGEHKFPAWKRTDFEFTRDVNGDPGQHHPRLRLIRHLVHKLDLSRVDDEGGKFRVITNITAFTKSRGGESEIVAYLRDPATSGGMEMNFTGLDPTNEGFAEPVARAPEPCSSGPNPAAGVLQFSTPAYSQPEERFGGRNSRGILITRTQGSQGAVSVTASAGGGTALPGVHYTPRETTVFFAAGDTEPRILELEILPNGDAEADRTVNLTLSAPGGCATLGSVSAG